MTRNLKITLAYDGSEFHGWQMQPGVPTVQGILAECLGRITGEDVLPQGSGRTDAGVHALAQVASARTNSPFPERNLIAALNDILPPSIRVTDVEIVEDEFSRAPFRDREDVSLSHLSGRHLPTVYSALCVSRSLSHG